MTPRSFDFRVAPCGRDMFLRPLTHEAQHWASDNLPGGERLLGSQRLIPEDRIKPTLLAIFRAGLTIAPVALRDGGRGISSCSS